MHYLGDVTVGFLKIDHRDYVAGWRTSTGEILWRHASPFHSVHGSHDAPMPHPGLLIGCLKVVGEARGCGDSDVVMVRGNLGEDYFLTADGFFDPDELLTVTFSYQEDEDGRCVVWTENGESFTMEYSYHVE